jgi:hypothetical protein
LIASVCTYPFLDPDRLSVIHQGVDGFPRQSVGWSLIGGLADQTRALRCGRQRVAVKLDQVWEGGPQWGIRLIGFFAQAGPCSVENTA